jgi:hypothetical protein
LILYGLGKLPGNFITDFKLFFLGRLLTLIKIQGARLFFSKVRRAGTLCLWSSHQLDFSNVFAQLVDRIHECGQSRVTGSWLHVSLFILLK